MKALQILKTVLAVVGLFALGILTGAFLFRNPAAGKNDEAQKAKEEKKDEIESTPAEHRKRTNQSRLPPANTE